MTVSVSAALCSRISHLAAFAAGKATVKSVVQIARFGIRMSRQTTLCSSRPYEDRHLVALAKLTASELTQTALIECRASEKHECTSVPITLGTLMARRRREIRRMVNQVWRAI